MRGFVIHAVVYAVVNALLVGIWLLTTGSTTELSHVSDDYVAAVKNGFWPLIVILAWGGGLVIHAAVVVVMLPGSKSRRRQKEARRREKQEFAKAFAVPPLPVPPGSTSTPNSTPHGDFGKQAAQAAIGLVESLTGRVASRPSKPPSPTGRQWVAVMFTDLVGSTGLAESLGDVTWSQLLADHRAQVRKCIDEHDGAEVGTQGDGFLVRFETPDAAVSCAMSLQRHMHDTRAAGSFVPELRVGIHAGEAVADDNDLVGRVINLAARVTDAAAPGEILVTEPVADHLSPGIALADRGLKPLKGFAQPRHLLAVMWHPTDETIVLTTELEEEQSS
ncbi:MAG TPA: adenylate/guanylate cyclase domain-containing protein [Acidimicrobiales bacterium]|nr:adenylate/guanylate cyclase domain-containing protein [Acidimicrobiales bacterium]